MPCADPEFFFTMGMGVVRGILRFVGGGGGHTHVLRFFKGPYIPPPSLIDPLIVSQRERETETEMNA